MLEPTDSLRCSSCEMSYQVADLRVSRHQTPLYAKSAMTLPRHAGVVAGAAQILVTRPGALRKRIA
jgi:hypothetical protein